MTRNGVEPREETVAAIRSVDPPQNASEARSFLGLAQFVTKFIPDLSTVAEPIQRLTHKNVEFKWQSEQQAAFDKLKELIASTTALAYFDVNSETRIVADASPVGLGAVLIQLQVVEWRVIAYASRGLTDVERRYSQTEREALALVWACERFNMYIFGRDFELETDHKPLEYIYSQKSKPSARVERWVLRLCSYGQLLLRGSRIVIPQVLGEHVLKLAHEGHQRIVKTKCRLRSKAESRCGCGKKYARVVMAVKLSTNIPLQKLCHELTHRADRGRIVLQTYWVLYPPERIYLL